MQCYAVTVQGRKQVFVLKVVSTQNVACHTSLITKSMCIVFLSRMFIITHKVKEQHPPLLQKQRLIFSFTVSYYQDIVSVTMFDKLPQVTFDFVCSLALV